MTSMIPILSPWCIISGNIYPSLRSRLWREKQSGIIRCIRPNHRSRTSLVMTQWNNPDHRSRTSLVMTQWNNPDYRGRTSLVMTSGSSLRSCLSWEKQSGIIRCIRPDHRGRTSLVMTQWNNPDHRSRTSLVMTSGSSLRLPRFFRHCDPACGGRSNPASFDV
jgi:hypothetical protein